MNTDYQDFRHKELTEKIIKNFYRVYNELGHGFLEEVYEEFKRKESDNLIKQHSAGIRENLRPN